MSNLFERRHLGRQEEAINETGIQIRSDDPTTPVTDQTWLNTSQNRLKTFNGTSTIILVEGSIGAAMEIPPSGILDATKSRSFYKEVNGPYEIADIANFVEGQDIFVKISNLNANIQEVTNVSFGSPTNIPNGSYFLLNGASDENKYYVWVDYDSLGVDPAVAGRTGIRVLSSAGLKERSKLTIPNTGISSGHHFLVNSAMNATQYYVWYNDGGGLDPMVSGKTGIQVVIIPHDEFDEGGDDGEAIAIKTRDAINATPGLSASSSGNELTVECSAIGVTDAIQNMNVPGLVVERTQVGKNSDTPMDLAAKAATAINAVADFEVPAPASNQIEITNTLPGFTEDATDGNMGSAVTITTTVQGSGKVTLTLPLNFVLPNGSEPTVPGESEKLFRLFKLGSNTLVLDAGTFSL